MKITTADYLNSVANRPRRPLRVLLVEDSDSDAILLERALARGGFDLTSRRVFTRDGMEKALAEQQWDLVLADHSMPQFSAPEALEMVKARGMDVPFIIVSGHIEDVTAVAAMRSGAHDYIMKDRLARLVPAVERELREAEMRHAERRAQEDLRRASEELEARVEQRTADLRDAYAELQRVFEERRRLEAELLEIAENERRRIGFDLHDDLGQRLTGISLMMKGLERRLASSQPDCAEEAGNIQMLVEQVILHTHNLAHGFSALDSQGEDLCAVLKDLANNVRKMFNTPCVFTCKGTLPKLPRNSTFQLHKIAQEAVSNSIKHGKATQVSVQLSCEHGRLVLTIRNDGIPFEQPSEPRNRMGLRIMNYRANTIGATFEINGIPGEGTVVTCTLPLGNGVSIRRPGLESQEAEVPEPSMA